MFLGTITHGGTEYGVYVDLLDKRDRVMQGARLPIDPASSRQCTELVQKLLKEQYGEGSPPPRRPIRAENLTEKAQSTWADLTQRLFRQEGSSGPVHVRDDSPSPAVLLRRHCSRSMLDDDAVTAASHHSRAGSALRRRRGGHRNSMPGNGALDEWFNGIPPDAAAAAAPPRRHPRPRRSQQDSDQRFSHPAPASAAAAAAAAPPPVFSALSSDSDDSATTLSRSSSFAGAGGGRPTVRRDPAAAPRGPAAHSGPPAPSSPAAPSGFLSRWDWLEGSPAFKGKFSPAILGRRLLFALGQIELDSKECPGS